jgi:hypothetical protein
MLIWVGFGIVSVLLQGKMVQKNANMPQIRVFFLSRAGYTSAIRR